MDINARHSLLREKLDKFGFTQPLPIVSIALVSALLDDLLSANNKLKETQKYAAKLEKEKSAWELGVEPYKCDNSKLLAEVNSLHSDLIRQRDTFEHKMYDLNKRIRILEQENRQLSDRCAHFKIQVDELESRFEDPKQRKSRNDLLNQKRKPFVSTVRSGDFIPSTLKSIENMDTANVGGKSKCVCQNSEKNDIFKRLYAEQEVNRVKSYTELIDLYKAQLDSRNREISRLNQLLVGGRPLAALEKDCCYRGIRTLADDVEQLQKEKSNIQAEYEEAIQNHHAAIDTIAVLKQQNHKIAKELSDFKEIALSVESEANVSLETLHKRNAALKAKLNEYKKRIQELEMHLYRGGGPNSDVRAAQIESQFLHEKLERAAERETELKAEVERLTKRNAKLKGKLSAEACKCNLSQSVIGTRDIGTMTSANQALSCADHPLDVNRLKIDRDFYKQEYMKLLDKPISDSEIGRLRQQLVEKEMELMTLRKQVEKIKRNCDNAMPCRSVEAVIHRLERERNALQDTVERLTIERNDLRDNLHLQTTTQREHIIRDECEIERLKQRIREIENENLNLHTVQGPAKTTITLLKDELNQLRKQITDLTDENSKLRASNNQMRLLQEQTENALTKHQNRLINSERQLNEAEFKLNVADSSRVDVCREIGELRGEINRLRNLNTAFEEEKDKFIVDLDAKTEKIHQLEAQIDSLKTRLIEMEAELVMTHRQLDNVESHKKQTKNSLHQITNEMDELRKQNKQLKTTNENIHFENRRLTNELADAECTSGVIKAKLTESEKEVDRLKRQLQQYVQEVQRAEELLLRKEEERGEMLEQYRNLTHDAVVLEGTNHSLELEASESRRAVNELESKLAQLQIGFGEREHDLIISNGKVCELKKQVNQLELDLERCQHERNSARNELDAVKELCNKLDIETDKLNAEVNEYSEIRRELERDNERLRSELSMFKAGDKAATESLKELLASARREMDDERISCNRHKSEIDKLKSRIEELQKKLSDEHSNAARHETLAKEYNIQIQELRNQLTDTRFDRIRSKFEQSNDRFSSI